MRTLFLFLCGTAGAWAAGPFSLGIRAGVPLTDFFNTVQNPNTGFTSATNRYIIGPSAELKLPFGLGIEFDALYRHLNYTGNSLLVDVFQSNRTTGNAWEFPLMAKYRFPTRIVRPYVAAGVAWDTLSGVSSTITNIIAPRPPVTTTTSNPAQLQNTTTTGAVIGVGVDIHAIFVHLSPEFRYTRWGSQHFSDPSGLLHTNQNQGEFLLGITF